MCCRDLVRLFLQTRKSRNHKKFSLHSYLDAVYLVVAGGELAAVFTPEECDVSRSRTIKTRHSFRSAMLREHQVLCAIQIQTGDLIMTHGTPKEC